jgi:hypothetical protein
MNDQKGSHNGAGSRVDGDEKRAPPDPVDKLASQRRGKAGQALREEDGAGCRVAPGKVLGPDAERQVQRAIAEAGDRVAYQQPSETRVTERTHSVISRTSSGSG